MEKSLVEVRKITTDSELVEGIRQGNESAYTAFVTRYKDQVARTVLGMLGNTPEADDVGQETFIRFFQAINDFRGDAQVGTYLTRIAINLSLNELKKRKRSVSLFSRNDGNTDREWEIADDGDERRRDSSEIIQYGLQKLDPKHRQIVILRMVEGYSTKETAEILELPVGTVLSRLARAQAMLKRNIGDLI